MSFSDHLPDLSTHAIAMKGEQDRETMIVSHVPSTLSRTFHLFLKLGGKISVKVTGKRTNKGIGLEVPATYRFEHKKPS